MLVGDLNIAPHMLDHCDWCYKIAPAAKAQFLQHRPDRQWFQQILVEGGGPLADVFRQFHPDRYLRQIGQQDKLFDLTQSVAEN